MSKELTKIVNRKCQDCGKRVSILCNESCQVVSVRCPDCFQTFRINAIEIERLQTYLEKKGWIEIPIERTTVIKMRAPHPQISVFIPGSIPTRRDLMDYTYAMKIILNTIAMYYEKTIDDVLSEVLNGVGEQEESWIKIWEEECGGRCAILHLERCPRYEEGECKFPDTRKAKEIVEEAKGSR